MLTRLETSDSPGETSAHAAILIAGSDGAELRPLAAFLEGRGHTAEWAADGEKAHNYLDARSADVLITELRVGRHDGLRLVRAGRERKRDLCAILLVDVDEAAKGAIALREGVYDYLVKPIIPDRLAAVVERGIEFQQLLYENRRLKRRLDEQYGLTSLIGQSRAMTLVYATLRQCASVSTPIAIAGESGTGKDLVAQAIHNSSARRDEPFVKLDCRAGTARTLEAELFGQPDQIGRAQLADGGTLYLDHADALPKKLRVAVQTMIADGTYLRRNDGKSMHTSVRLVVSTESAESARAVMAELEGGREDALILELPPLRDRLDDLPMLLDHFLSDACRALGKATPRVSRDALAILERYAWPGNVAELCACAETMAHIARGVVTLTDVPEAVREATGATPGDIVIPAGATMKDIERIAILETMRLCDGDKGACAKRLGIGLRTLYRKLKEYESVG